MRSIAIAAALVAVAFSGAVVAQEVDCPAPRLADCDGGDVSPAPDHTPNGDGDGDGDGDDDADGHPNAGRGNGSEGNPDQDPGNSGEHNKGGD